MNPSMADDSTPWADALIDDIWGLVISSCLSTHQKNSLRQACRRFRRLVNASILHIKVDPSNTDAITALHLPATFPQCTSLTVGKPGGYDKVRERLKAPFNDAFFARWSLRQLAQLKTLTAVSLEHCMELSVAALSALALACPQINTLTLPRICLANGSDALLTVLPFLPSLGRLHLRCCSDVPVAEHLAPLCGITSLELEFEVGANPAKELSRLQDMTQLKSMVIWSSFELSHASVASAFQMLGPAYAQGVQAAAAVLELLDDILPPGLGANVLSSRDVAADLLKWIHKLPSLTCVDVQRVNINHQDLRAFTGLPLLSHLGVGNLALDPGAELHVLTALTKLVTHCCQGAQLLPACFPALRALSCDACDTTLAHVGKLTSLAHLLLWQPQSFPSCSLGDAGLRQLSSIKGLVEFRLEGADGVTDQGWKQLSLGLGAVTRLHLTSVTSVSPQGLAASLQPLHALRHVLLACMGAAVEPSVLDTLLRLPLLTMLELEDCTGISRAHVEAALASMPRALSRQGPDITVLYRKGGAARKLTWP